MQCPATAAAVAGHNFFRRFLTMLYAECIYLNFVAVARVAKV